MARVLCSKQGCPLELTPWEGSLLKALERGRAQKHYIFIMGQKIQRKDWTSKSVESKLLSSVLFLGRLLIFKKKSRYHYKGKKRGLIIFNCMKICFFGEGVVTYVYWLQFYDFLEIMSPVQLKSAEGCL
jgi:hypothetical protein